ncbi:MAG: LysM peptidoglycan-binding domain-containing protein [Candidatus Omnitrophota bacterium]|nr:LysM peptidoglycan-binding domain-containing protein [Candidatus Omnitrophota bacterium]MBU1929088.1 LysM peptidoglycan-binding domain-containing protein [Candidatus Omnitrophota bacterium]MBU1929161.1 LysM peptidoglycan-binding domain-containing protein [Candidatus Omnitrophota bacterium]MBU2035041.1 LysM peptidoglycan-binding domain-containing protein [Candidatus Omnitrophota bacterium]MBU2258221.1 LysM peptidoglycan-binding domain-containing protein [Candidatus Omnitrophota bacterium]
MRLKNIFSLIFLFSVFIFSGCVARTYQMTRDRVDQDLPGNRGCLQGKCLQDELERKKTRTIQVVEIEIPSLTGKKKAVSQESLEAPLVKEKSPKEIPVTGAALVRQEERSVGGVKFEKYTVLKDDTLQKISEKFYGTSNKWEKIYETNKAILKTPDRLYPGESIDIPIESGKSAESIPENKKVKDNIK